MDAQRVAGTRGRCLRVSIQQPEQRSAPPGSTGWIPLRGAWKGADELAKHRSIWASTHQDRTGDYRRSVGTAVAPRAVFAPLLIGSRGTTPPSGGPERLITSLSTQNRTFMRQHMRLSRHIRSFARSGAHLLPVA